MASHASEKAIDADHVDYKRETSDDVELKEKLGYDPQLMRARSLYTLLFQSLAITAVPFGEGTALNSAIIGGGQLAYFLGWIVVAVLDQCIAMSLAELASRYPTASGPYYWSYQLMKPGKGREVVSFFVGWVFLVGNWTIALSVNFGSASLIAGTVTMCRSRAGSGKASSCP